MPVGLVKRGWQFKAPGSHEGTGAWVAAARGWRVSCTCRLSWEFQLLPGPGLPFVVIYRWLVAGGKSFI